MSKIFLESFVKFKQIDSDSIIMEKYLEITFFHLFGMLLLNITENVAGFALAILKSRGGFFLFLK